MDRRAFVKSLAAGGVAGASLLAARRASASSSTSPTGFVDVTDPVHGADPSGNTPSAAAFASAATAAQSSPGCILWIPPGTYDLQGMSALSVGSIEIAGAGRDLVTLQGSASSAFLVPQAGSSLKLSGVSATGFKYVVQATPGIDLDAIEVVACAFRDIDIQVFGGGGGVSYGDVGRFTFVDNVATDIGVNASFAAVVKLSADRCNCARVEGNVICGVGASGKSGESYGIYLRMLGSESLLDNVKVFVISNDVRNVRQDDSKPCSGIMVLGGQAVVQGNHIEDVLSSASTADSHGIYTKCRGSVISGNSLVNSGGMPGAIVCKGANRDEAEPSATPGYDVVVSDNSIRQDLALSVSRTTAIAVTRDGCIVANNHVVGTQRGVDVWSSAKNTIVQGNFVFGLVAHDPSDFLAGVFSASVDDCMILDNQVVGLSGGSHRFGVYVKTAGGASGSFRGCLVRGNWIADLSPQGSNAVGIRMAIGSSTTLEKLIVESNHVDAAGWGVYGDNVQLAAHSASIWNSASNVSQGDIHPASGSWTIFQQ